MLYRNSLYDLPDEFVSLTALKHLDGVKNPKKTFRQMSLSDNELTSLPSSLDSLKSLRGLAALAQKFIHLLLL